MKKSIIIGIVIGLVLSLIQIFVPYTKTIGTDRQFYRGWPLANQGVVGFNDSFHKPPINANTFINIPILILLAVAASLLTWFTVSRFGIIKGIRWYLFVGLIVGLLLGLGQIFYTSQELRPSPKLDMRTVPKNDPYCTQKVAYCGYCPKDRLEGYYCTLPPYSQILRGWPKKHDTYDTLSRYDTSPTLGLNIFLLTGAGLSIGALSGVVYTKSNTSKKTNKKSKTPRK